MHLKSTVHYVRANIPIQAHKKTEQDGFRKCCALATCFICEQCTSEAVTVLTLVICCNTIVFCTRTGGRVKLCSLWLTNQCIKGLLHKRFDASLHLVTLLSDGEDKHVFVQPSLQINIQYSWDAWFFACKYI